MNTVWHHLYENSKKQENVYNKTQTGSQIQRTNYRREGQDRGMGFKRYKLLYIQHIGFKDDYNTVNIVHILQLF